MSVRRYSVALIAVGAACAVALALRACTGVEPGPADGPTRGEARSGSSSVRARPTTASFVVTVVSTGEGGDAPAPFAGIELSPISSSDPARRLRAVADREGRAVFGAVAVGEYRLNAVAESCESASSVVNVDPASLARAVRLRRLATAEGRVVGPLGGPAPDAVVAVRRLPAVPSSTRIPAAALRGSGREEARTIADSSGRFVMLGLPLGAALEFTAANRGEFGTAVIQPLGPGASATVSIHLSPATGVRGRVASAAVLEGRAAIDCFRDENSSVFQEGRTTLGRASNEFLLAPLTPGPKLVTFSTWNGDAFHVGFVRTDVVADQVVDVGEWTPRNSELTLEFSADEDVTDVRDVDIGFVLIDDTPPYRSSVVHLRAGLTREVRVRGLPAGRGSIEVSAFGPEGGIDAERGWAETQLVFDGASGRIPLRLTTPRGRASSRITISAVLPGASGAPPARLRWVVWSGESVRAVGARAPIGSSAYQTALEPGRYRVEAFGSGLVGSCDVEVSSSLERRAEITDWRIASAVEGRVLDARESSQVELVWSDGRATRVLDEVPVASDGTFHFSAIPDRTAGLGIRVVGGGVTSGTLRLDELPRPVVISASAR